MERKSPLAPHTMHEHSLAAVHGRTGPFFGLALAVAAFLSAMSPVDGHAQPRSGVEPTPTSRAAPTSNPVGSYWCQVEDSGVVYAPTRCVIKRTPAGALLLEKLSGSQRFSGVVLVDEGAALRFSGLFFCPQGACDEFVQATFSRTADGYAGALHRPNYVVTMTKRRPTRPATP